LKKKIIIVKKRNEGERLDAFLKAELGEAVSRAGIKRLIDQGQILLNDKPAKAHRKIKDSDAIICLTLSDPKEEEEKKIFSPQPQDIPLNIVYEDKNLIIVDKPAGMVVHPACGNMDGTLVNALLHHVKGEPRPEEELSRAGLVHRIDKEVSGILVIAKDTESLRFLAKQFEKRTIDRRYQALVKGVIRNDFGLIDLPIGRSRTDRKKMQVRRDNAREARTKYKVLKRYKDITHLEIKLMTGRTHQIRVHLSYLGHPILGDTKYGGGSELIKGRIALHAASLSFTHPVTGEKMTFKSNLPEEMRNIM